MVHHPVPDSLSVNWTDLDAIVAAYFLYILWKSLFLHFHVMLHFTVLLIFFFILMLCPDEKLLVWSCCFTFTSHTNSIHLALLNVLFWLLIGTCVLNLFNFRHLCIDGLTAIITLLVFYSKNFSTIRTKQEYL